MFKKKGFFLSEKNAFFFSATTLHCGAIHIIDPPTGRLKNRKTKNAKIRKKMENSEKMVLENKDGIGAPSCWGPLGLARQIKPKIALARQLRKECDKIVVQMPRTKGSRIENVAKGANS